MALTPGTRLGVYQILAPIGAGGMGQVFRARDTTLDRDVALKVLPDAFAQDGERVARFTREAKTLAALNHPHIAAIYGLEARDGLTALVMELVEGEDLSAADRRLRAQALRRGRPECRSTRRCRSRRRSPRRSKPRTSRGSSTAT